MQGTSRDSLAAVQEQLLSGVSQAGPAGAAGERYAKAADDLFGVVGILTAQPSLRRALSDPALPAERKRGLVDALFGGKVGELAQELLDAVAQRRWSAPRDVLDAVEVLAIQTAFTVAEVAGELDDVEDELFRFQRIVRSRHDLRSALTDPALPTERKVDLLKSLLEDKATATTVRLVTYVATQPRRRTFENALDEFARLAAQRRQRLVARVTSAVPLDERQQERLAAALQTIYGRAIQLQLAVDPEVLGGVVVRVGDEVIDGTVAHRLDEARRRLAG